MNQTGLTQVKEDERYVRSNYKAASDLNNWTLYGKKLGNSHLMSRTGRYIIRSTVVPNTT